MKRKFNVNTLLFEVIFSALHSKNSIEKKIDELLSKINKISNVIICLLYFKI
jgi:hypothetical protein